MAMKPMQPLNMLKGSGDLGKKKRLVGTYRSLFYWVIVDKKYICSYTDDDLLCTM